MSLTAREVGKKLLDEVEEANLSEILGDLRTSLPDDPSSTFNVPALDRLVDAATNPHQPPDSRRRPPAVELLSAAPASGKTHLLYYVIAAAVLPERSFPGASTDNEAPIRGGKGGCVVVIDTDMSFDVLRLAHILRAYLLALAPRDRPASADARPPRTVPLEPAQADTDADHDHAAPASATLDALVSHALTHIHVFAPSSLPSLLATARALPTYLQSPSASHTHASSGRPLSLLALTSSTAFLHAARHAAESARLDPSAPPPAPDTTPAAYGPLARALRAVQTAFGAPLLAAGAGLAPVYAGGGGAGTGSGRPAAFRHVLPAAWRMLLTARVGVERERVRGFGEGGGEGEGVVEGAERDRGMREAAVRGAGFACWVVGDGEGAVRGAGAGFAFRVDAEGGVRFDG